MTVFPEDVPSDYVFHDKYSSGKLNFYLKSFKNGKLRPLCLAYKTKMKMSFTKVYDTTTTSNNPILNIPWMMSCHGVPNVMLSQEINAQGFNS